MDATPRHIRALATFGPAVVVLFLGLLSVAALRQVIRDDNAVESAVRAESALQQLMRRMLDAETAQRGYLVTGEERFLAPSRGVVEDVGRALGELRAHPDAGFRTHLDSLAPMTERRLRSGAAAVALRRQRPLTSREVSEWLGIGRSQMDEIRHHVEVMTASLHGLLARQEAREERLIRVSSWGLAIGGVLTAALAALTGGLLTRHERAAESQRDYLRSVIEANPNPVFAKDREGRFRLANAALASYYGTTPDQLMGRTDADFNPNAAEVQAFMEADRRVIDEGVELHVQAEPVTDGSGRTRWLETRKVRFVPAGGGEPQVLAVSVDVTERRALEAQLRHAQKMDAVGRLAGGIAHDFNNILAVIKGSADFMLLDLPPDHPSRQDAEQIAAAADRGTALTRQLLGFSRKQPAAPRLLDPSQVVGGLLEMLRRLIGSRIVLTAELAPTPEVLADPGQLEQVLTNLVVNARDAMPEGGRIKVSTHADGAPDAAPPGQSFVCIAVEDTGEGIAPEVRERLFEPFFTTKAEGKGTGLGLATVDGIVRQAGGTVEVESTPGAGTTFSVYLPAANGVRDGEHVELSSA